MDLATLAGSVIAILTPYVAKAGENLVDTVGQVASDHAKRLFDTLKARWSGDPVAKDKLERFEKKPEVHAPALQEIVEERLATDATLRSEVEQTVKEVGPKMAVFLKMTKARGVTVLKVKNVNSGDLNVNADIADGEDVIVTDIENFGR